MSLEAFRRTPRRFGWSYEYIEGVAHVRPAFHIVVTSRPLEKREIRGGCEIVPASADLPLLEPYLAAFSSTIEYWRVRNIATEARRALASHFEGKRGPSVHSFAALQNGHGVGAAPLTRGRGRWPRPLVLDLLFVDPAAQRRGIASDLLASAMASALEEGEARLFSLYDPGNEASAAWHHAQGFVDEPDLALARARLAYVRHETERRDLCGEEPGALVALRARIEGEVRDLENLAAAHGWERTSALHRLYAGNLETALERAPDKGF
jgi:GNAT superfamily N-acetyltransferase